MSRKSYNIIYSTVVLCTAIYFNFNSTIHSQSELIFKHITMKDGLPDDGIEWVLQDHLGFMWFATRVGMVKYDGYEFIAYKASGKDTVGSMRDRIRILYEDSRGDIWAGADGFLNRYIREKDTIISYASNDSDAVSLKGKGVFSILEDSDGNMWFGNYRGWISFVDRNQIASGNYDLEFKQIKETAHDETYIVFNLFEDKDKNIWACTRNGLLKISGNNIEVIQAAPGKKYNRKNTFFSIVQDSDGEFWIGTYGNGIANFNELTKQFKFYPYKDSDYERYGSNNILSLLLDSKGNLWAGTQGAGGGGLLKFDRNKKTFERYSRNSKIPTSLMEGAYFHNMFEDNSGTIWLPAFQGGVTRIDLSINQVEEYYYGTENYNGINREKIKCFYESKDRTIWVGTNDGLLTYNPENKKFSKVQINLTQSLCKQNIYITQITEDSKGNLWLNGGWNRPLWVYNPHNNKINCFTHKKNSSAGLSNPYLTGIAIDKNDNVWISTYGGGLNEYDINLKKFKRYWVGGKGSNKDDPEEINRLCLDTAGGVWVASYDRTLNYFDKSTKTFTRIPFHKISCGFNTTGMMIDSKNRLWIATRLGGITIYNIENKTHKNFSSKDGLPANDRITDFFEDIRGNIYCRSAKYLMKFNPKAEYERFYKFDLGNKNLLGSYYVKSTDEIFLTTADVLIKFKPDKIFKNKTPPKMVLTEMQIFDDELLFEKDSPLNKPINLIKSIELEHWQNDITLKYAALHYTRPEENKYKYMLENYDDDWRDAGFNRSAGYTNLSYGKYKFKVIGANCDGVWATKPATLEIIINPPWWLTWWAYILYTLIFVGILSYSWMLQVRRMRIINELKMKEFETQKLKEVDRMKSNFFANISHEFRTPLTLIKGPIERLLLDERKSERKEIFKMILKNTKKLLNLINELLDLSKLEAGKMKLCAGKYDIVSFTKGIVMSFKSLAESKEITLSVKSEKDYLEIYFDKEKMQKILSNLVANALKYTPERGKIDVNLVESIQNNRFIIQISDTGIGIEQKEIPKLFDRFYQILKDGTEGSSGTGIGLALTKELVLMHKGSIDVYSEPGKGSIFTVSLTMGKEHLSDKEIILAPTEDFKFTSIETINIDEEPLDKNKKALILVVEDNTDVLKYIRDILKSEYNLITARDGKEGYKKAIKNIPDLIVSDIMMPILDGNKMCELIRKDEKTSHIPVIMLTAKAAEEDKITGLETGADDYIIKPFDPIELVVRIKNLINQRNNLRQKYLKEAEIHPTEVAVTSVDKLFIKKAIKIIEENLDDPSLGVESFADSLSMSRSQLYRKFCAVLGEKPNDFIKKYRLRRAADLFKQNFGNVAQVAFEVGFNDPAYFSKCFKKLYKMNPFEYEKKYSQKNELEKN